MRVFFFCALIFKNKIKDGKVQNELYFFFLKKNIKKKHQADRDAKTGQVSHRVAPWRLFGRLPLDWKFVDLRSQDEIIIRQPADRMR